MINPTQDDISSRVVCQFKGKDIFGTLVRFDADSVFVETRLGEQAFNRSEVEWESTKLRQRDEAKQAEPMKPLFAQPAPKPAQPPMVVKP